MRMSDWSAYVGSSELTQTGAWARRGGEFEPIRRMAQRSSRSSPGPLRRYLDAQTSPVAADPMEFWVSQDGGPRDLASFQPAHARAGHDTQPATTGPDRKSTRLNSSH